MFTCSAIYWLQFCEMVHVYMLSLIRKFFIIYIILQAKGQLFGKSATDQVLSQTKQNSYEGN